MGYSACRPSYETTSEQSDSDNEGVEHANMTQLPGRTCQPFGKQVFEAASHPPVRVMRLVKPSRLGIGQYTRHRIGRISLEGPWRLFGF